MEDLLEPNSGLENNYQPATLPNSTAVLVLGIVSIVMCLIGFITGIIAIVLHKKDKAIYLTNPAKYEVSFKNSRAGYVCAIIGLILSVLVIIFYVVYFIILFTFISNIH